MSLAPRKILLVTDAWAPQINGVVRTLEATVAELQRTGHSVQVISPEPERRLTVPLPSYPEIQLDFFSHQRIRDAYRAYQPDHVHIATEGPLGWAARWVCLTEGKPFSTAFHTHFPEYVAERVPRWLRPTLAPTMRALTWAWLRRFHAPSGAIMVATPSIARQLRRKNFHRIQPWSRGVNIDLFKPYEGLPAGLAKLPRPISIYVGRVAVEKNLDDFLSLDLPGSKVVIGDGPDFALLKARYPQAHFLGRMAGETLARHYAAADLFVFPSHTDTFGLVLLEAMACGLPVAAYPAPGPRDIFANAEATRSFAQLNEDLGAAARALLANPPAREAARAFASQYSWANCTAQFLHNLQAETPFGQRRTRRFARALDWLQGTPRWLRRQRRLWQRRRQRRA